MNKLLPLILAALAMPSAALADGINSADTAWVMTSTALVLMMTIPGLSMFYAGLVRSKNVLSVFMQCFALCCLMSKLPVDGLATSSYFHVFKLPFVWPLHRTAGNFPS